MLGGKTILSELVWRFLKDSTYSGTLDWRTVCSTEKVILLAQLLDTVLQKEKRSDLCLDTQISLATQGVPDVTARLFSHRPSQNCTSSSVLRLRSDLVLQGMVS